MLNKAYNITIWLFIIFLLNFPAVGFSQQNDARWMGKLSYKNSTI